MLEAKYFFTFFTRISLFLLLLNINKYCSILFFTCNFMSFQFGVANFILTKWTLNIFFFMGWLHMFSQIRISGKLFGTFSALEHIFSMHCTFVLLEIFKWCKDFIAYITWAWYSICVALCLFKEFLFWNDLTKVSHVYRLVLSNFENIVEKNQNWTFF